MDGIREVFITDRMKGLHTKMIVEFAVSVLLYALVVALLVYYYINDGSYVYLILVSGPAIILLLRLVVNMKVNEDFVGIYLLAFWILVIIGVILTGSLVYYIMAVYKMDVDTISQEQRIMTSLIMSLPIAVFIITGLVFTIQKNKANKYSTELYDFFKSSSPEQKIEMMKKMSGSTFVVLDDNSYETTEKRDKKVEVVAHSYGYGDTRFTMNMGKEDVKVTRRYTREYITTTSLEKAVNSYLENRAGYIRILYYWFDMEVKL